MIAVAAVLGAVAVTVTLDGTRRRVSGRLETGPASGRTWHRLRRVRPAPDADARLLERVARSLRSGVSVLDALDAAASSADGALADDLRPVVVAARSGRPLGSELRSRLAALPPDRGSIARLLVVALEQGGSSAAAVADAAAIVRADAALRADAAVQSSQAMASAAVVSALPVGFLGLTLVTTPSIPAFLVGSPLGWAVLVGGLGLDAVGLWWMRRMVRTVVP